MPLDQFKTQVLLLHSEQSTLDTLSSGFSDRYTVHCATSGSEALTTLGETPINVIISAQNLPGMSGVEALREAKKRSPETIGILLAGPSDTGLEALVGDEEVFQVVRGDVTGDKLLRLVDSATQQMRLMALAESANDTAASPDEPQAEHIIMETSENGSTIISGGTGRLPALNPDKISPAAAVGARAVDVLVLTKDQEFLTTIRESSRGMHAVHYANTLAQADEAIRKHKVGVAVVDAAMVGQKVEQLTLHLRKGAPRLVSIVAGRRDDGEMLMDLITRGKVYRFLLKPVSPGRARLAVEASVKHHLEAPDSAFRMPADGAASKPQPPPKPQSRAKPEAAKPAPKPTAKPAPPPAPKPAPTSRESSAQAARPASAAPARKEQPPRPAPSARQSPAAAPADPPLGDPASVSPIEDGLADAFGEQDSRFARTVSGILGSVGRKGKSKADTAVPAPATRLEPAAAGSGGSLLRSPKTIGIAAGVVVAVAAGAFWLLGGSDEPVPAKDMIESTPSITEADVDLGDSPAADTGVDVDALIDEARLARDAGQVFNPLGSNAIELYAAAAAAAPGNVVVAAELAAIVAEALGMAETALLENRLDDASAALERVAMVDADNDRLPFLEAQLSQMQLRGHLADARAAIRDNRFEDAGNALAAARALGVDAGGEIGAVAEELNAARSQQRVDEVLALATARVDEGDLLVPANDNARYYYELVLSSDPANAAARQGLNVIASKLALQARTEIDNDNLDAADRLISDARAIDASNADLAATAAALANAREAVAAAERRAEEARRQAEAERRAAEERAEAERLAEEARVAEEARAAAEAEDAAAPAADSGAGDPGAAPDETVDAGVMAADTAGSTEPPAAATVPADEAPATGIRDQAPASISSLQRTRYVAPKYPRAAQRRSLSGWVDVVFTVAMDGSVKDIEVRNSEPGDVFVNAAVRAVERWEFEPVIEDGVLVEKRAGVRMMFALE